MSRFAALLPFVFVACADTGDEGMYVINNTAPPDDSCVLTGSRDQPFNSHGVVYFGSSEGYVMTPLIQSRVVASTDTDDTSRTIQLRGADVKLTLVALSVVTSAGITTTQPNTELPSFSALFSGAVPPAGTANVDFTLIPASTLLSIAGMSGINLDNPTDNFNAEVLAEVSVRGVINDNTVQAAPYLYPVTVCKNCVVNNLGSCPLMDVTPRPGNPCNPAQDGVVDCCTSTEGLVCPAPMSM
jgi:hypothetical protein